MAFADRLAGIGLALKRRSSVVFPDGWGDRLTLELLESYPDRALPPPADIVWERKSELRGARRRRGMFRSPLADLLPDPARVVGVELTEPGRGSDQLVVLLPAWNDEGLARRRSLAELLASRGIASAAFEIPLYGRRRRDAAPGTPIRTVADFALMGLGAVDEAAAVLAAVPADFPFRGVGGFSMGGNLAALVSARSPEPLATGLMAAPHSPTAVYVDGVLSRAVAWKALGGSGARSELQSLLAPVSTTAYPARPHHRHAVAVAGTRDGFVSPGAVETLVGHWPGSEVRWVDAGHAGLRWRHAPSLVEAITDSFDRQRGSST